MLLYFKFNNFYSFLGDAEVSFQLGKQATKSDYDIDVTTTQDELRLNKVMAVLGSNGSGKTQLLKALSVMRLIGIGSAVIESPLPAYRTFFSSEEKTEFEIGFVIQNSDEQYEEYRYELVITNNKIEKEALYKKTSSQFSYIFMRSYKNSQLVYKHRDYLKKSIADDVKTDVTLLSFAVLFEQPTAINILNNFTMCQTNVTAMGRALHSEFTISEIAEVFQENPILKMQAEKLLNEFDTGINSIDIRKVEYFDMENQQRKEGWMPFTSHNYGEKTHELNFYEESNGTQSSFKLLGLLLPVLHYGTVAIIDELDNDLHPHLLPIILDLFRSKHTNPHNAQLIFSCHTPEVFNLLNKHQIYLVEKYQQQSETWRLDDVEGVRNDDNLYAKYMAGAFDAVPNI